MTWWFSRSVTIKPRIPCSGFVRRLELLLTPCSTHVRLLKELTPLNILGSIYSAERLAYCSAPKQVSMIIRKSILTRSKVNRETMSALKVGEWKHPPSDILKSSQGLWAAWHQRDIGDWGTSPGTNCLLSFLLWCPLTEIFVMHLGNSLYGSRIWAAIT